MVSFLSLLPRTLTTFLFALAALLRFYGNTDTEFLHLTSLQWSFLAFNLGSAALVANLGLEWNTGRRSRAQAEDGRLRAEGERRRAEGERLRAEEERRRARERETRRDDLADEERNKADQERERAARRARIQNRWIILQVQYQIAPEGDTRAALTDFVAFLQEYGE